MNIGDSDAASVPHTSGIRRLEGFRKVVATTFDFEGWEITVLKSPILPSNCYCDSLDKDNSKGICLETGRQFSPNLDVTDNSNRIKCQVCRYKDDLQLKHYPEMVFPDNILHLLYKTSGFILNFNTLDAMKLMGTTDTHSVQVAMAEAWQASKIELGLPKDILHNFNWTFTTEYKGSLKEHGGSGFDKNDADKLNLEKLMQKENILFYEDIMLFEDELHDNGISNCTVKIRVMPSGFFILLRHFLRVDHVMAKVCDTRIHFEKENNYFLRQYQVREELFKNLNHLDPHTFSDINVLYTHLPVRSEVTDKIFITHSKQ